MTDQLEPVDRPANAVPARNERRFDRLGVLYLGYSKPRICDVCGQIIPAQERCAVESRISGGLIYTFRSHMACHAKREG